MSREMDSFIEENGLLPSEEASTSLESSIQSRVAYLQRPFSLMETMERSLQGLPVGRSHSPGTTTEVKGMGNFIGI